MVAAVARSEWGIRHRFHERVAPYKTRSIAPGLYDRLPFGPGRVGRRQEEENESCNFLTHELSLTG